jgi:hypothetical protein
MTGVLESIRPATVPISKGGQVSLPAEVRRRWGVARLLFIDHGDWAEVRPLPDNPIAVARGMLRREGATPSEVLRARERRAEAERTVSTAGGDDHRSSPK